MSVRLSSVLQTSFNEYPKFELINHIVSDDEVDETFIQTYEDYEYIFKIRHDLIHAAICEKLQIPWGEKAVSEVFREQEQILNLHQYYNDVKAQTPDYLGVKDKTVNIVEVTVSGDLRAKDRKAAKYALLCKVLRDVGYNIEYKIFVINPRNVYMNRNELLLNGLDDNVLDFANRVCDRISELVAVVHRTNRGQSFYHEYFEADEISETVNIHIEDVLKTHDSHKNKCFHDKEDLIKILREPEDPEYNESDKKFMLEMLNKTKDVRSELFEVESFDKNTFFEKMRSMCTSNEMKSFFPLPYFSNKVIDSSKRSTESDWLSVMQISSRMESSDNSIIASIGRACRSKMQDISDNFFKKNDDFLFICKLSPEEKFDNAIEGPQRKHYVRQGSSVHIKAQNDRDSYSLNPFVDVDDVKNISFHLSQKKTMKKTGIMEDDMKSIYTMDSIGLNYLRVCQSIYREININSMRGDRRHKYIIKPTGVEGVFICLYPGTKLRSGELANIVWFKIIIDNEFEANDTWLHNHWAFKKLYRDRMVSYTRWLSCDVHRLDHYIRCFDKIIMAYCALMSQKHRLMVPTDSERDINPSEFSLIEMIDKDDSNTLGLIMMTYLEDKRSTSKMLQNVRYLVMTSISMFPKFKSVMDKFTEAIRSPLQLHYLKKCVEYVERMKNWKLDDNVKFGTVRYDFKSHTFLDTFGGSLIKIPRPLIDDSTTFGDFSEILCEMYFTMLFNKNQDDPTHSSFQVLDKIIEGENNFKEVKAENKHLGYDKDDLEFAKFIIDNPKAHQFSSKSIEIGSKLLRLHLDDPFGEQITRACRKSNLNKTLDEYATFKSSSVLTSEHYNPQKNRQNQRRRCIEGVNDLLNEGLMTSFEVADKYKNEETFFHVFKKNQIGGVREILILPITNRIRINILETISRNICFFDKREVLTHGVTKNESIKSILYSAKKLEGTRVPIHLTFDKSKWGPSFVPIQFLYMFKPFKEKMGNFFPFLVDILIRHQNKVCVLPDRLVRAWYLDEDNKYEHKFSGLQSLKESFLYDDPKWKITYENESNMGQGILHYTSSLLHLCMISFRDELYKMWCKELNLDHKDHHDLLSSDDSYTIFCPEISKKTKESDKVDSTLAKVKIAMFLKCQQVSEYLFNCRTSKVKSSINPLIGEFNSLFISNMTFIPTLFKYCLSSVHPVNTDSFFRMVKECYSSSRQIVENGGSLELYYLSSLMNKEFCESIYHTYPGGVNDLSQLGLSNIPYHMGHYPLFDPALMLVFGPEYHNYLLYKKKWIFMNDDEKHFFTVSHKVIKGGLVETMAEFENGDTVLGGLLRIEAQVGPVKQLERIRTSSLMLRDDLSEMISKNPMLIILRPKTLSEVIFKTTHKLYTTGSKEALKNLAASIFYGRVSATVSANAFHIPFTTKEPTTYLNCVKILMNESSITNLDDHIRFIYPKFNDYDIFADKIASKLVYYVRSPLEIQTIQTLVTHKIYTKLLHSVPDVLSYLWGFKEIPERLLGKVHRDFDLIKVHFPLIKDTLEETEEQFSGEKNEKIKSVLMLILKLYSLKDRNFKGVVYGYGSNDVIKTYSTLMEKNMAIANTAEIVEIQSLTKTSRSFEKLYCAHNYTILSEFSESKISYNMWQDVTEEELVLFFQDPRISRTIKKRIFMCAVTNGFIKNAEDWSSKVGIILHYWHKKQKRIQGEYKGTFNITLFMGTHKLNCYYNARTNIYNFIKTNLDDPIQMFEFFSEFSGILDKSLNDIIQRTKPGNWVIHDDKILQTTGSGFEIKEMDDLEPIDFNGCYLEIDEKWSKLIDSNSHPVFTIETGLLTCTFSEDLKEDFKVFGMMFTDFLKLGSFNQNFNVLHLSRKESLKYLTDLDVPTPRISKITKRRIRFIDDWPDADMEEISNDITIEDTTDFLNDLITQDFTSPELAEMLPRIINVDNSNLDDILNFIVDTDVINSMKTTQKIQHSRKIFLNTKNLKFDLIAIQITENLRISSQLIRTSHRMFKQEFSQFIKRSLVSVYDRLQGHEGTKSPEGMTLNMNKEFLKKFRVLIDEEEE